MFFRKKEEPEIEEELAEEEEVQNSGAIYIILPVILQFVLGALVFLRSRNAAITYLYAMVPMLFVTAALGTYAYNRGSDMKLFTAMTCLASMGIALQITIEYVYHPVGAPYSAIKYAISLAIAVAFVAFYHLFRLLLNKSFTIWLMFALAAAVYIVLMVNGIDANGNGTTAWFTIGNLTVQLTDFIKVAAVMFYSALFSVKNKRDDRSILTISTLFFLMNLVGSVLIHELGSFFILYGLHLSVLYIFLPHSKMKRVYLLTVFITTIVLLAGAYMLYKILLPYAEAGTLNSFTALIWPIVKKVYLRFSITANLVNDPYGAGYQLLQGKRALWMSGFFGNTVNFVEIPVPDSDMAFISLVNSFGLPIGFLAVLLFAQILFSGGELSVSLLKKNRQDAVVVYGITVMLFAQAMFVILGSCNVIPLAGLPIPFLSRGFTYQSIVFCFSGLLLHLSEDNADPEGGVHEV
ncbi:MAG: FtsW/RodA/SpoVE family cell cycle protein [Erysipelotrichaceae bacterium]|nr:FtsW/RodA/SpoVE family cell cycle protein [Erysipelotrichaceae bacterium]